MGAAGTPGAVASAITGATVGIGALVSIWMAAGHLWPEWMRMIERSTSLSALATAAPVDVGKYQSARNSNPTSMPPTNTKYRTRGIDLTANPAPHIGTGCQQREEMAVVPVRLELLGRAPKKNE